ncbi:hypothetical protein [Streptomyces griseoluteus]|uniref:hypothetical protein n=1 Tax=Streptomyces griseoluteus TaxID=29306 RepID=UPI00381AC73F
MTTAQPWFDDLADSVRALGSAAGEYQLAFASTITLQAGVDLDRRRLHAGKVAGAQPAAATGPRRVPVTREPHADAVFQLRDLYTDHAFRVRALYEHAAMLFASGCAWAIRTVQQGGNPNGVLFELGADRRLQPGLLEVQDLKGYARAGSVTAAYEQLLTCMMAASDAEALGQQGYLPERDADAMYRALSVAEGTADAAYQYGLAAEGALHWALIGARREHARREAAVRQGAEA